MTKNNLKSSVGDEAMITVAVVQMPVVLGDKEKNLAKTAELSRRAVNDGAKLLVFPELCNTGYVFNSRQEVINLAEKVPDGNSILFWEALATELQVYMILGVLEVDAGKFYNTAVLIGPDGYIGSYRKLHLFYREKLYFEPGNLGLPIFSLPFGRVGLLLCYDLRFFEAGRILMLQGADIICAPTNWLVLFDRFGFDEHGFAMQHYATMVMANINNIFIACANRVGQERDTTFFGKSLIVSPSGWPIGGLASESGEEILLAKINLMEARIGKSKNEFNDIIRDRRHDVYDEMLGYLGHRYPY